jgi:hypothetical protein
MSSSFFGLSDETLVCFIIGFIVAYNNERKRSNITREALILPKFAPWRTLLLKGNDSSFLSITGFSKKAFWKLVQVVFEDEETKKTGRPRLFKNEDKIGLVLMYLGSQMSYKHLSLIFGILPCAISAYLRETMGLIVKKLKSNPIAEVRFPDDETMALFASMVNHREPEIHNVIGFGDGLALRVH